MKSKMTVHTLAARAGVSSMTVSRVLNHSGRISMPTRNRILGLAQKLGYRRNRIAASLRTNQTKTVGILAPSIGGPFYGRLLRGIESVLGLRYRVLLGASGYDAQREREIVESFRDWRVDGFILVSSGFRENLGIFQQLQTWGRPVIQAERCFSDLETDVVEADNERIGYVMTEHLLRLGHRRIVFARTTHQNSSTAGRETGYQRAMQEWKLAPQFHPARLPRCVQEAYPFARAHARELLETHPPPLAIVAHDMTVAYGAIKAVEEAGLKCPQDVSICGAALPVEEPIFEFLRIKLTAAEWSVKELGVQAAELLLERLQHSQALRDDVRKIRIPCRLTPGDSTAPPLETRGKAKQPSRST